MNRWYYATALLLGGVLPCGGCGTPQDKPPGGESGSSAGGAKVVAVADLKTGIGQYMPPLDDGRVEMAAPESWKWLGRTEGYLVRFYHVDPNSLPRILVTAEDSSWDAAPTVTRDSVDQFAEHVARQLGEEGAKPIEPVKPMIIGPTPCARYVIAGKFHDVAVERQVLKTQLAGRVYTIELQVFEGTILKHRDAGYAVAASLRPAGASSPDETESKTAPEAQGTDGASLSN